jgi:cytoskeletal protein RodZ
MFDASRSKLPQPLQASNGLNFMRRRNFFMSILTLCALALSGWSGVLAATFCPYAARANAAASLKTDAHASCHAQSGGTAAHTQSSSHEAMGDMEAMTPNEGESPAASAQVVESCRPCCISHGNLPTAPVGARESQQNGREAKHTVSQEVKTVTSPPRFIPAVVPTQGSPPGQLTRRHLLLSIFII